jgi:hypothetical protein
MRVTARDFSAAELDQMFPGISIYARMRWDPELGAQCTSFTGTKVQILTQNALRSPPARGHPAYVGDA